MYKKSAVIFRLEELAAEEIAAAEKATKAKDHRGFRELMRRFWLTKTAIRRIKKL
jgi:hypothetical protein